MWAIDFSSSSSLATWFVTGVYVSSVRARARVCVYARTRSLTVIEIWRLYFLIIILDIFKEEELALSTEGLDRIPSVSAAPV